MVFKKHPVFKKPENENAKIWRYMDFTKFVSMLDTKSLYFTRIDLLEDKFEGSVPKSFYSSMSSEKIEMLKAFYPKSYKSRIKKSEKTALKKSKKNLEINLARRKWTFVNCWHVNEDESAAMWKLYLKSNEGVAIQTTYKGLCASFDMCDDRVWIGLVKYIDYNKDKIPMSNSKYRFVYKRKSFEYERELRAVVRRYPISEKELKRGISVERLAKVDVFPEGLEISVDLDTLIQKVHVSPYAEKWFEKLVKSVAEKYELAKEDVKKSPLAAKPIY